MTAKHPGDIKRPIRIGDGGGLYLQVAPGGGKSWLFRYRLRDRDREMGLGTVDTTGRTGGVTLLEARDKSATARKLVRSGIDPLDARRGEEDALRAADEARAQAEAPRTFQVVTEAFLAARQSGWSNPKHRAQWEATLKVHAFPSMGKTDIGEITTDDVLRVLRQIWNTTPETASRVRGRIEAVLDFARAQGWRHGDNPAQWRGHLAEVLPKPGKVKRIEHRPSLSWREMPAFMAALRERRGAAIHALAFAILTVARTGEVRLAKWQEIDLAQAVWTVPAERMKARRRHRVPLSPGAMAILEEAKAQAKGGDSLIFPSLGRDGKALSDMTLSAVVRRMNEEHAGDLPLWRDAEGRAVVPHGFRSTFRDWAGETRAEGREVAEAALAHSIRDKAEAAYARSDLLEKRRPLMAAWSEWCSKPPASVVQLSDGQRSRKG